MSRIAPEPVNIDGHASKKAEEHLSQPTQTMFDEAQNQVIKNGLSGVVQQNWDPDNNMPTRIRISMTLFRQSVWCTFDLRSHTT